MKTYNVGVIGFGFIGRVHSYGWDNLKHYYPDAGFKVKLLGVCERQKEAREKAKNILGFEHATDDYRELVKNPDIDIIDICSPNTVHKEQILAAMKEGKHIYCEKPLVCDTQESEEILRQLADYKGTHQAAFHNRFYPASLKAKSIIDGGSIGEIVSYRIAYYHSGSLDPDKKMGWKQGKGAGILLDLGSHASDLIYYFAGEFSEIGAAGRILYPERFNAEGQKVKVEVEDLFVINAKMKSGAIGTIEASKVAAGTEDELKYEIYGTKGALRYNSMQPNYLEFCSLDDKDGGFKRIPTVSRYPETEFPGPKFAVGWIRGHMHSIYNFANCVFEGRQASPSFNEAIYNTKIMEAAKYSSDKKKIVTIS